MADVPPFTDGAVAELRHGADGTVIAEIRIPGPAMADRDQEALDCAARRRERESRPLEFSRYVCRCDHGHPPDVIWCDLCEYPVYGTDEAEA